MTCERTHLHSLEGTLTATGFDINFKVKRSKRQYFETCSTADCVIWKST